MRQSEASQRSASTPIPSGAGNVVQRRISSALRGMSYAEGAAMLAPVQQRVKAPQPAAWSRTSALAAYEATRTLGWSPDWITALQAMLDIEPKGIASLDLANAVAERELAAGRPQTGRLDGDNLDWLMGLFPVLATIPRTVNIGDAPKAGAKARGDGCPEDLAIRQSRMGTSYKDYAASTLRQATFCGHAVIGHPVFLARLSAAEAYLSSYNEGLTGAALGEKLGITMVSSYRPNRSDADELLHGLGFAIDINKKANDWNFGNGHDDKFATALTNAGVLFAQPDLIKSSVSLGQSVKAKTTEEAFDEIAKSNDALRRYRAFATDEAGLEAYLASDECPEAARSKGLGYWKSKITSDHRRLVSRTAPTVEGQAPGGFMDHDKQRVTAMRDAGGLRWGGSDFSEKINGDFMHFDGYNSEPGKVLRDRVRDERMRAGEPYK